MKYKGLNQEEVLENRKKYGSNKIEIHKENKFFRLFLEALGDPIIKILLIALGIKIVFLFKDFDFYETIGILIAVMLATFISTISEYGSEKAFLKLEDSKGKNFVKVKRDLEIKEIEEDEVVCQDIVYLEAGDKIPADGVLLEGSITVDEKIINGEAKESVKVPGNINVENPRSFLYKGTTIYNGSGIMLVKSVGLNTLYGKLALELQEVKPLSPLKNRLTNLAKVISRIGYIGAILVGFSYLFSKIVISNNYNVTLIKETLTNFPLLLNYLIYALTLSVTIIVVAVPEGLPMMITLVLSSNMKRMLKDNVLVRKLTGIETAGNLNVLLTDKTGTLTKGTLEVIEVVDSNLKSISKDSLLKEKKYFPYYEAMFYNSDSLYDKNLNAIGGNSTDRAIYNYLKKPLTIKKKILKQEHFSSFSKYSSVTLDSSNKRTYFKGASEVILLNSTKELHDGVVLDIKKDKINKYLEDVTKKGIRIIALAYKDYEST